MSHVKIATLCQKHNQYSRSFIAISNNYLGLTLGEAVRKLGMSLTDIANINNGTYGTMYYVTTSNFIPISVDSQKFGLTLARGVTGYTPLLASSHLLKED